uniref:Uncharacterized protein n=1 Tax=Myoviridae sp. ctBrv3 TaxID=2825047 RepID=A0A8S5PDG8_9CAUD|nr:MAG TPA: hypothetical protein [Myoviridae sp. ctBrv3]
MKSIIFKKFIREGIDSLLFFFCNFKIGIYNNYEM